MSEMKSPLTRLVLFMVCLSVAGALIAGVHYLVIEKPLRDTVKEPANDYRPYCMESCYNEYSACMEWKWVKKTAQEKALCESALYVCRMGC